MPDNEIVVALDVGTTKICAIVGEVDSVGSIRLLGMGQSASDGLRKGVVVDIEVASQNIRTAVKVASANTGVEINSVVVGVTGDHISSTTTYGSTPITHANREITEQDVQRVMEMARSVQLPPGHEIIHILPRGFTVDGMSGVKQPIGMCGCRLGVEAHVIVGASAQLQNVLKSVERAGLLIDTVALEPVATSEAVLADAEKEMGVLVADIGGGTTDIAIFMDGAIAHSVVIPVGGNHVTNDLAVGLKTSRETAEQQKKDFGCAMSSMVSDTELVEVRTLERDTPISITRKAIAEIIEPRMQELFALIAKEILEHGYQNRLTGCVLSGGGSLLVGSVDLAQSTLKMPVRIGRPRKLQDQDPSLDSPIFATAVGLLCFGAARQVRHREEASTQRFVHTAWDQFRQWLVHIFGG